MMDLGRLCGGYKMGDSSRDLALAIGMIKDTLYPKVHSLEGQIADEVRFRTEQQNSQQTQFQRLAQRLDAQVLRLENALQTTENRIKLELLQQLDEGKEKHASLEQWKSHQEASLKSELAELAGLVGKQQEAISVLQKADRSSSTNIQKELNKAKTELLSSFAQTKTKLEYDDSVLEQRMNSGMIKLGDELHSEVHTIKKFLDKKLNLFEAELSQNISTEMEQLHKIVKGEVADEFEREANVRMTELASLENVLKDFTAETERNIYAEMDLQVSDFVKKVDAVRDESRRTTALIQEAKDDLSQQIDGLFSLVDEFSAKNKDFAKSLVAKEVAKAHEELTDMMETDREVFTKDLDKSNKDLRGEVDSLRKAQSEAMAKESSEIRQQFTDLLAHEKKMKDSQLSVLTKNLDELMKMTNESLTQTLASVESLVSSLVTQEKSERLSSEEGIVKNTTTRMNYLEDLIQNQVNKYAEEIRALVEERLQEEQQKREDLELFTRKELNRIRLQYKELQEGMQIEATMNSLLADLSAEDTERRVKQVEDELYRLGQTFRMKMEEAIKEVRTRVEASEALNAMIALVEGEQTKESFLIISKNMEKLNGSLQSLADDLTQTIEDKVDSLKGDIEVVKTDLTDTIDAVAASVDTNTINIEDVAVASTMDKIVTKLATIEQARVLSVQQVLLEEVEKAQKERIEMRNRIVDLEESKGLVLDLSTKIDVVERNLLMEIRRLEDGIEPDLPRDKPDSNLAGRLSEVTQDVDRLKAVVKKLEAEQAEKAQADGDVGKRLEQLQSSVSAVQRNLQSEMEKTSNEQHQSTRQVSAQLERLFAAVEGLKSS
jgi:DNA repair exonuclease SbcCD ATPase subunit